MRPEGTRDLTGTTDKGVHMPEVRKSVIVNVPPAFADREWTEFVFSSLINWYRLSDDEYSYDSTGDESEADMGFVSIAAVDDDHTRVTVDLAYMPHNDDVPESEELKHARRHLEVQLEQYKRFVEAQFTALGRS